MENQINCPICKNESYNVIGTRTFFNKKKKIDSAFIFLCENKHEYLVKIYKNSVQVIYKSENGAICNTAGVKHGKSN